MFASSSQLGDEESSFEIWLLSPRLSMCPVPALRKHVLSTYHVLSMVLEVG